MLKTSVYIFLISCFLLLRCQCFAQEVVVKKSNKIEKINGKKYYIHEIQKGETIYSVSKAYGVDKNIIALENPEVFEKFSVGQILHIPYEINDNSSGKTNVKIHEVTKGETLYSISKKYNVTIKELLKNNPDAENGLQIGQKLKISVPSTVVVNTQSTPIPGDTSKYFFHTVEKGQTVYSISKQYNISIDQIYQENPELETKGLKNGEVLRIPKEKKIIVHNDIVIESTETDTLKEQIESDVNFIPIQSNADCGKYNYKSNPETINIALILPLQGDAITLDAEEEASVNPNFEPNPKPFLEYYEGFLMAIDSMKRAGLNLSVKTIDLRKDSAKTQDLINKGELNDMDLIVGPVFESNFKMVSEFALKKGINIIYPINSQNSEIFSNPRVFLLNSSLYSQMAQATKYLAAFKDLNYILIHNETKDEQEIVDVYKKILFKEYQKNFGTENVPYKEVIYSASGLAGVENSLSKEKINVLIIPSSNQIFVINILTKLQPLTKKFKIILSGMPAWKKFENNLELEYLHNLNMHTFVPFFVDYSNPFIISFVEDYREKYKCEPSKYSFLGFDTGIYFLTALMNYGHDFQDCIRNMKLSLTQSDFNFVKVSEKGGYENNGVYILHYNLDNDVKIVNIVKDSISLPLVMPDIQVRKTKQQ